MDYKGDFIVRWAQEADWEPAMQMVWKTFLKFEGNEYTQLGIKNFFDFVTDDDLRESFLRGEYVMVVAEKDGEIVGAGSLRGDNFLSLLFVDERYHRQGIATALLDTLCDYLMEEGQFRIVVNSSPYAVGFYEKKGFTQTAPEMAFAGIRVTQMNKLLI